MPKNSRRPAGDRSKPAKRSKPVDRARAVDRPQASDRSRGIDHSRGLDRSWHLARTAQEMDVAELEYALIRCWEGFGHWQAECLASVAEFSAGPDNALLHMIRMNDRPKSLRDLAHMANRDDIPNLQYSLRKLIKGGLITRSGSGRSGVTYETTSLGKAVTDRYADVRAHLLIEAVARVPDLAKRLQDAAHILDLMTGIYEQAARAATTHRHRPGRLGPQT